MSMEEDFVTLQERLDFEEGKCHLDMGPSIQERRLINTQVIVDEVDIQERK